MKAFAKQSVQVLPLRTGLSAGPQTPLSKKIQLVIPGCASIASEMSIDDVLLLPDERAPTPARRLVALVPSGEVAENILARRVWQLAVVSNLSVLYLTLSPKDEEMPYHRRRLTNLVMMTSDGDVRAHSTVIATRSWFEAVRHILQPGDMLVCLANHRNFYNFHWRRMLGEQLAHLIGMPVYMLGGIKIDRTPELRSLVKQVFAWTSSLTLITTFFFLQIGIGRSLTRPLTSILLFLSVLVEMYILLKINSWIG
jgi:hypothetical protein